MATEEVPLDPAYHSRGHRMSLADRRVRALRILAIPERAKLSDRLLGRITGLSGPTVAKLREVALGASACEAVMQDAFCKWLGSGPQQQVACDVGFADVVDDTWVYELKTSRSVHKAVGQAVLYSVSLGRKPCIVLGAKPPKAIQKALAQARIALVVFRHEATLLDTRANTLDNIFLDELLKELPPKTDKKSNGIIQRDYPSQSPQHHHKRPD